MSAIFSNALKSRKLNFHQWKTENNSDGFVKSHDSSTLRVSVFLAANGQDGTWANFFKWYRCAFQLEKSIENGLRSLREFTCFRSMKRLGILPLLPGWDASPSQGYPPAL